ncbi:MAG: PadR family transcriptional regulator, partial [Firmicutes bacterium]|nr:PadR family transcriptional regulator [Bacillota bacterium]
MSNTIHSDILRGHINTIILRSLLDSNKYGEEVYNVIKQRSQGQFSVKKPTIYSALSRLEQKGCINSYWGGKETRGGRRKYYSITELGREIVQQSKLEWEYSREVLNSLISKQPFDLANEAPVDLNASTAKGRRLGLDRTNIVTPKKYKFADDETEAPQQEIPNLQATAAQVTKEAAEQETLHSQVQQDTTHQQQDTLQAQDTQHFAQNNDECREVNIIDTPQDNDKFKQILQANSEIQTTIHQQDIQHQQDQSTFIEHTTIIEKHTTIIETNIIQQDHQQADLETQQVANQPTEQQADQIASQVTDQSANQGTDQSEQPYAQDNQPEFVIPSHTKPVQTF